MSHNSILALDYFNWLYILSLIFAVMHIMTLPVFVLIKNVYSQLILKGVRWSYWFMWKSPIIYWSMNVLYLLFLFFFNANKLFKQCPGSVCCLNILLLFNEWWRMNWNFSQEAQYQICCEKTEIYAVKMEFKSFLYLLCIPVKVISKKLTKTKQDFLGYRCK